MALKTTLWNFHSKFNLVFTTRQFLILKWGKTTRITVYPVLWAEFLQKPGVDFSQFCLIPSKFLSQVHHKQEWFSPKEPKKINLGFLSPNLAFENADARQISAISNLPCIGYRACTCWKVISVYSVHGESMMSAPHQTPHGFPRYFSDRVDSSYE